MVAARAHHRQSFFDNGQALVNISAMSIGISKASKKAE
jgi:hypothetical protein